MERVTKDAWRRSSLRTKELEVEGFGIVLIRELPSDVTADLSGLLDIVQIGREQRAKVDVATMEARQFAYGVIDDAGDPMFTEAEARELARLHGRVYKEVVAAIDELSGIDKEAVAETEARFPVGGESPPGSDVGNGASPGSGGPSVPARAGAGAGDVGATDDDGQAGDVPA